MVIVGPTASGKSELAVRLAKKFNGEIISADSRQVYRGLNIGTGKVPGKWRPPSTLISIRSYRNESTFIYKGVPHHCIDFVPPRKIYTVAEYKKCAAGAIQEITARGKLAILVGGTGFWIDAVVFDFKLPPVPPDPALRKTLEKKSAAELLSLLKRLDPKRARAIEQKNPRRLIRAIEIAKTLGRIPKLKKRSRYRTLWISPASTRETLQRHIRIRLRSRLHAGLIEEAKRLHRQGLPWRRFYELGLEYRFLADLLRGKLTKKEFLIGLPRAINNYARRQMTWWKRNKKINWIRHPQQTERLVKTFTGNRPAVIQPFPRSTGMARRKAVPSFSS